jgi:hypothetical protein
MKKLLLTLALLPMFAFGAGSSYYGVHLTANGTTTPFTTTIYIKSVLITCTTAGTTETVTLKNKEATAKTLYISPTLTVGTPLSLAFDASPIQCVGGLDIVYGGSGAGVVDVFVTYE